MAAVEEAVKQHPQARQYRITVKHNWIEVYEQVGPNYATLLSELQLPGRFEPSLVERLQSEREPYAQYMPVLRFNLLDPAQRLFSVQRMCYLGGIDGWLKVGQTGSVATLAHALIPTLGTDQFYELW